MPGAPPMIPTVNDRKRPRAGCRVNWALCLVIAAMSLYALGAPISAQASELYETRIPVVSKDVDERNRALRDALAVVTARVSGRRDPANNPLLIEAFRDPARYLQQFRYEGSVEEPMLWALFDAAAVDDLLRSAGLPVWDRVRPTLLMWAAVERRGERQVLTSADEGPVATALRTASEERGLPMVLPLMDLEDRANVETGDIWAGFSEAVGAASARYAPEAVGMARAYQASDNIWEVRWTLSVAGDRRVWTSQGDSPETALSEGLHIAVDTIASRYTDVASTNAGPVLVVVSGVYSLEDYARTSGYLQSLDSIKSLNVTEVLGDRVRFSLRVVGGRPAVERLVALGTSLIRDVEYENALDSLYYRLTQ